MEPKQISSNLTGVKLTLLLLGLFILVPALFGAFANTRNSNIWVNVLLGAALTAVSVWLFVQQRKVMFDDKFMYITNGQRTKQVPLENIYKIKLTMASFESARFVWKIGYMENNLSNKTIRILPSALNNYFEEFKIKVREKNPSATIKSRSHSFDFDQ